jgi:glc operon protein GlcG
MFNDGMTCFQSTAFASIALALVGAGSAQQLATRRVLTLEVAKKIAAAAETEAVKNKWTMYITVVDDSGMPVYIERIDETQLGSFEVSLEKARSAVLFKRPTKVFEDQVAGGRTGVLKLPGALPVEGGIPLMADGKVIGGIGVSGGTSSQDGQVAQAGVAALETMLKAGK